MRENIFERLSSMKDKNKGIITHTIRILERANRESERETICKEIMSNSFPELM